MMENKEGYISPLAVIGEPPEHRDHRWKILRHPESSPYMQPIIHPTAIVEALATIDSGITVHTYVGEHTMVMKHSHIGHDAYIEGYVNIAPGAIIGGHCRIYQGAKIGIGALIRPRVIIHSEAIIGAGAVVVRDVPSGETWAGNPARSIQNKRPTLWTPEEEYDAWMEWYDRAFGQR